MQVVDQEDLPDLLIVVNLIQLPQQLVAVVVVHRNHLDKIILVVDVVVQAILQHHLDQRVEMEL